MLEIRPTNRRKTARPRFNTYPQMTRMKLRSFDKKCVCQMEFRTAKNINMLKLRDSGDFIDKILGSSDQEEFSVHHIVMSSLSPTISQMMETDFITILPYQKEVVQVLVMLAYTGSCEVKERFIEKTLEAAKEYEIEHLVKICGELLISHLTERSAMNIYRLSVTHFCDHVSNSIIKFICINFKNFVTSVEVGDASIVLHC